MRKLISTTLMVALVLGLAVAPAPAQMMDKGMHTSKPFTGPKANTGTVSHSTVNGKSTLTLSDDFVVPDSPDPHWRVVDSNGVMYDLAKLKIKNDGYNKSITVPGYVKNVAKVVIWCAWAEVVLGETAFDKPVK